MSVNRCCRALTILSLICCPSLARGTSYHSEDRYNPQHIDGLPPEIRASIHQGCTAPEALHTFASYRDGAKQIVLHFERFICDGSEAHCGPAGCLHQLWVVHGAHYRLTRRYYAPAGD